MSLKIFGREVAVSFGGLNILGRQTQGLTVNNEPVDVTDSSSGGWREVADIPGQKSVEMPISGAIKNLELLKGVMSAGS